MNIVSMRKCTKPGSIKAYFNLKYGLFILRDFKLMESSSGLWVSFPKKGSIKAWYPTVELSDPEDTKTIELLSAMARDEYLGTK